MLAYLFALLTACANAAASVLQRAANRKRPADELFHPRLIARILREPLWFCGVLAMIASFLLLATALANGPLSVVQPLLVLELPLTLILADLTFGRPTRRNEWFGIGAISLGLAGLLLSLAPQEGGEFHVSAGTWAAGIGGSAAAMVVLIILAKRSRVGSMARPALLAVATGTGFGVNSAIIKAMTVTLERGGWVGLFTSWPVYGVLVCGLVSFFLLQTALGSGPLIAAQPGLTGSEPIVAMIWGVVVFDEHVRSGVAYARADGMRTLAHIKVQRLPQPAYERRQLRIRDESPPRELCARETCAVPSRLGERGQVVERCGTL